MRSDWNCALLQDVIAPSYAKLLLAVQADMGHAELYYQLWPQLRPAEPWGLLVDTLYESILASPVLRTEANGGGWVSPTEAVFAEQAESDDEAVAAMHAALLRSGMPLVTVPKGVHELLQHAARKKGVALTTANAKTVRQWLQGSMSRQEGLSRAEGEALLAHCLRDVATGSSFVGGATAKDLHGLKLVPLSDGSLGLIQAMGLASLEADPLLLCAPAERPLLERRSDLLVAAAPDEPLGRALARVAATGQTNVQSFGAAALPALLPLLLPAA